jgi:sugar phosphate isomerase/epimerase
VAKMEIAVQLYTVRDLTTKDFPGTMKQVADIGYKYVELAGYGSAKEAKAAKSALDAAGLKAVSGHYGIDLLTRNIEQVANDAETLDMDMVVCPFLPDNLRKDAKSYRDVAKMLAEAGNALHQKGIELLYHNHAFEFEKLGGEKTGLEILFDNTEHHLLKAELDIYWVKRAGQDPVAWMDKLGERTRMLHLKDMAKGTDANFAPVGTGVIDFKAVLAAADKYGVRYGAVEQDKTYDTPPLDAIKASLDNLKKMRAAE